MKILAVVVAVGIAIGAWLVQWGAVAQDDGGRTLIKEGLKGAAVGAIASGASEGKAGKGALIGAGTGVLAEGLFSILSPEKPAVQQPPAVVYPPAGAVVADPQAQDAYNRGFQAGYQQGFQVGFQQGYQQGVESASRGTQTPNTAPTKR